MSRHPYEGHSTSYASFPAQNQNRLQSRSTLTYTGAIRVEPLFVQFELQYSVENYTPPADPKQAEVYEQEIIRTVSDTIATSLKTPPWDVQVDLHQHLPKVERPWLSIMSPVMRDPTTLGRAWTHDLQNVLDILQTSFFHIRKRPELAIKLRSTNETTFFVLASPGSATEHIRFELTELKKIMLVSILMEREIDEIHPDHRHQLPGVLDRYNVHISVDERSKNARGLWAKINGIQTPKGLIDFFKQEHSDSQHWKIQFPYTFDRVEFRQQASTTNSRRAVAWARFALAFIRQSCLLDEQGDAFERLLMKNITLAEFVGQDVYNLLKFSLR